MLLVAIIIFVLTALGGAFLLSYVLTNKETPKGVALIHGAFGASGIILLLIYSIYYPSPFLSIILFVFAAFGGLYLFFRDLVGRRPPPKILALGHGLLAVIAFLTLLYFAWNSWYVS